MIRLAGILLLLSTAVSHAQDRFALPLPIESFPNFVALGVGAAPDYFGSDEYIGGAAPAVNVEIGPTRLRILGNWAMLDLLESPGWSLGPAAIWRFGRSDVDDAVVAQVSEVDDTVELGISLGYEFQFDKSPFARASVGIDLVHDVGGVHDSAVVNGFARAMYPLPWRGGAVVGLVGATFVGDDYADTYYSVSGADSAASGLPAFSAGGGTRDLRVGAGLFQSLSLNWHVGAGVVYSRMLGDTADSPIVDDRGSANQFIFGIGAAYTWGIDPSLAE